jgi:hypothetical protein
VLEPNSVAIRTPTGWMLQGKFMDYKNLIVLQFLGLVLSVSVLIMRSAEFEPDEVVAGN